MINDMEYLKGKAPFTTPCLVGASHGSTKIWQAGQSEQARLQRDITESRKGIKSNNDVQHQGAESDYQLFEVGSSRYYFEVSR